MLSKRKVFNTVIAPFKFCKEAKKKMRQVILNQHLPPLKGKKIVQAE